MLKESSEIDSKNGASISLKELIDLQTSAHELILPLSKPLRNFWVGGHISAMRGRGMEFEEVRVYSPGDDVRTMDWRVTARSNTPHVKIFREERERPVFLVVDFSPTMFFGTRVAFKSVIAAKIAALIAWSTALVGDRIGAVMFSEHEEIDIKPASRLKGVLPILNGLTKLCTPSNEPAVDNSLTKVLSRLGRVAPTGSMIFILSDFENLDEQWQQHMQQLCARHQIIAGMIYDPLESELPEIGVCQFTNGNENLLVNTSNNDTRHRYSQQFYGKMQNIRDFITRSGQSYFQLATNEPILPVLQEVLRRTGELNR